jgi:hypothetical protein
MPMLTLKISQQLSQRLAAVARRRGVTRSRLVRDALERSLQSVSSSSGLTCLDLARDLVGSHDGPSSLASDPKHLKGYGR